MQEETDAALVLRALADDTHAFPLLIERYQVMVLLIALRCIGDREIAHEMVQEAFLQAYLSLRRLRDPARFRSWLYGIILNLCRSWKRERAKMPAMLDLSRMPEQELLAADPASLFEEQELRDALREAVEVLSPHNQTVVRLFYDEGWSIQE